MDGTVLNSKGEISEANINAIKKSGLPFTLVSARSPQKMENIINTLGIDGIHVSFNGALIFEKKNKENIILHRQPLDFTVARNLVLDLRDKFSSTGISLYDELNWNIDLETDAIIGEYNIVKVDYSIVDFKEYFREGKEIYKVSFIEYNKEIFEKIVDYVQKKIFK